MERKLVAILAADIVGYSRLMAEDETGTFENLQAAVAEVVVPTVEAHGGRVVKTTGDGFLAVFESAGEALDCAVAVQEGFAARPLSLRIGINLGDVIQENGDVFGDGVNVAARLQTMAKPGSIYVSAAVMRAIGRRRDLGFERLGNRRGKNLPDPIEVFAVRAGAAPRSWLRPAVAAATLAVTLLDAAQARFGPVTSDVVAVAGGKPTVAVLPFDDLSGDAQQDWFTDGLTEDLITVLAGNRDLMVLARNSTFIYKGRAADIRTVGAELGARYVVEGSARRAGDQLRVVAQLIDAADGSHLWSRSYDRTIEDVFAVQTDVARQIAASLVTYVREAETEAAAARPTESLRAYELVLQGRQRFHADKGSRAGLDAAKDLFARALEMDPDYATAHAHLGLVHIADHASRAGTGPATGLLQQGMDRARRAIRLEPDLALGYQVLSYGLAESGDFEGGLRAAEQAVRLTPSDPDSLMSLAKAQVRFGAYVPAIGNAELARRLHPFAPDYYPYVHGQALYAADRLDEAQRELAACLVKAPNEPNCLRMQAAVLARLDRQEEAREHMARLLAVAPALSLDAERRTARFGDAPAMQRYLADLAAAGAPEQPGGSA